MRTWDPGLLNPGPAQVSPGHRPLEIDDIGNIGGLFDEPLGVNFYFVHFPVCVVLGQGHLDKLYCLVRWDGNVEDLLPVVSHFDNPGRFRRNDAVVDYGARAEVERGGCPRFGLGR